MKSNDILIRVEGKNKKGTQEPGVSQVPCDLTLDNSYQKAALDQIEDELRALATGCLGRIGKAAKAGCHECLA